MKFPAEPDRVMYHGEDREYVPATRQTVMPGCDFDAAASSVRASVGEVPPADADPLGEA